MQNMVLVFSIVVIIKFSLHFLFWKRSDKLMEKSIKLKLKSNAIKTK